MSLKNSVAIFAPSRFHYQQLALQLIRFDLLCTWVTALPSDKIPQELRQVSCSMPLALIVYLLSAKTAQALGIGQELLPLINYFSNQIFDYQSLNKVKYLEPNVVIGLSHSILTAGLYAKSQGGRYFCDVPIAHPNFLNRVLGNEYSRLGVRYAPIHKKTIHMEMRAHHESSSIICPSTFVKDTFIDEGVAPEKLIVIPYGSVRKSQTGSPIYDNPNKISGGDEFNILFVGQVTIRKGVHFLLEAFSRFNHPRKRLVIAGPFVQDTSILLSKFSLDNVSILGRQTKEQLHRLYSQASVFVLPSIAEGLAYVVGEAMAYGLPIIYTYETGASEIISNNVEGIMVKSGKAEAILEALIQLSDDRNKAEAMAHASLDRSGTLSGWDKFGDKWNSIINCSSNRK